VVNDDKEKVGVMFGMNRGTIRLSSMISSLPTTNRVVIKT
jgi:hypothetical protein